MLNISQGGQKSAEKSVTYFLNGPKYNEGKRKTTSTTFSTLSCLFHKILCEVLIIIAFLNQIWICL